MINFEIDNTYEKERNGQDIQKPASVPKVVHFRPGGTADYRSHIWLMMNRGMSKDKLLLETVWMNAFDGSAHRID